MFLSEVLIEMETLKSKIFQLEKYLKQAIIDNINLYEETITKLFELIDKYRSHLILINKVNKDIPEDVFETNWFERELVHQLNKTDLLENLSAVTIEKHFDIAKKIWHGVWKLNEEKLAEYVNNLTTLAVNE